MVYHLNDFDIFEQLRKGLNIHFLHSNAICDVNSKFGDKSRSSHFKRELYQMLQDNGQELVRALTAKTISVRYYFCLPKRNSLSMTFLQRIICYNPFKRPI